MLVLVLVLVLLACLLACFSAKIKREFIISWFLPNVVVVVGSLTHNSTHAHAPVGVRKSRGR